VVSCGHTDAMKQMAQAAFNDYMDIPEDRRGTSVDFSGFDVVCCNACGCPLQLVKKVDLLEGFKMLRAMSEVEE
jgi:hypothetical protein